MPTVVGIDIARGQWVVVQLTWTVDNDDKLQLMGKTADFGSLQKSSDWSLFVIDVPIGLFPDDEATVSDKGRTGDRPVDRGARRWCRSSSSVFPPPTKGQLLSGMDEHRRAADSQTKIERKRKLSAVRPGGLTQQTFELLPAIEDARRLKAQFPDKVFESHPEVVFSVISAGVVPLSKLSFAGALLRVKLLSSALKVDILEWILTQESNTGKAADNWLDAIAMALVAMDWVRNVNQRNVLRDASGIVTKWDGHPLDFLMAIPNSDLTSPPKRTSIETSIQEIRNWLVER
jgi:predicted RNase H-like nuclease